MSCPVFPIEIQYIILQNLIQDGGKLANFATVSRTWQEKIEQHTFARIRLTESRLAEFDAMTSRNRSLVRYLWLCLELERYDCTTCAHEAEVFTTSPRENTLIVTAIHNLFSVLSTWESSNNLSLDITVYSPSDSEHWFPHLTFEPDTPWSTSDPGQEVEQTGLVRAADDPHDWVTSPLGLISPDYALLKVFGDIMTLGPFDHDKQEDEWWQRLPLVSAVTNVLLRQQNRRRWKPRTLAQMLARLPRLRGLHYEPWREWADEEQESRDECKHFHYANLTIFENFNQQYEEIFNYECEPIRTPSTALGRMLLKVSLNLESLSGSFMVDAWDFFNTHDPSSQKWPNLTSLVLTSQLLAPDQSHQHIMNMLKRAGLAATRMPKLKTMEIWNGREKLAALFKYELLGEDQPAIITWKSTWDLILQPSVIRTWEAVMARCCGSGLTIVYEALESDDILSHGDAIVRLSVSELVVRPISLQQIQRDCNYHWFHDIFNSD
ncbi:hypothetical protein M441DRAFT_64297 [Trichoderma asperellum CBS 433.97]|uniref:DUF6546 domain-containing protein n=1 Tax=Trichoderma asperellum (strain ATCC 204424 / CBS 433.97 / NBRC 101777) TaxID=1042311 RepID=A0A2T3ZQI8_TRIA4|nr:hypothetical protein M441DRAFT_64297 [Trichoderma asperellum CBS 433.97]PTB47055.1 hypothetical protein M441DRAFT_64297 [Trichoderma asperellum CBS 433.97]